MRPLDPLWIVLDLSKSPDIAFADYSSMVFVQVLQFMRNQLTI